MFKNIHELMYSDSFDKDFEKHTALFTDTFKQLKGDCEKVAHAQQKKEDLGVKKDDLKLGDIVLIESLYTLYMKIFNINEVTNHLDPLGLIYKYLDSCYKDSKSKGLDISNNNKQILMFWKLFSHINQEDIYNAIGSYFNAQRFFKNYSGSLLVRVKKNERDGKLHVRLTENPSTNAKNRHELYKGLLETNDFKKLVKNSEYISPLAMKSKPLESKYFLESGSVSKPVKTTYVKKKKDGEDSKEPSKDYLVINHSNYIKPKTFIPTSILSKANAEKAFDKHKEDIEYRVVEKIFDKAIKRKQATPNVVVKNDITKPELYRETSQIHEEVFEKIIIYKSDHNGSLTLLDKEDPSIDTSFKLGQPLYIVGPTGSGKSITTEAELVSFLRQGLKILYVTKNNAQSRTVFKMVNKLIKKNNLNVEPPVLFSGKRKNEQLTEYLFNSIQTSKTNENILDILTNPEESDLLDNLDTTCFIKTGLEIDPKMQVKTGDFCGKIKFKKEDNKCNKHCYLYTECGYYKRVYSLEKSNIWIVNEDTLFYSTFPEMFDRYTRSFLELALVNCDIIIKDEADELQAKEESLAHSKKDISHRFTRRDYQYHGETVLDAVKTSLDLVDKAERPFSIEKLDDKVHTAKTIDQYMFKKLQQINTEDRKLLEEEFVMSKLISSMIQSCSNIYLEYERFKKVTSINYFDIKNIAMRAIKNYNEDDLVKFIKNRPNSYIPEEIEMFEEEQLIETVNKVCSDINKTIKDTHNIDFNLSFDTSRDKLAYFQFCRSFYILDLIISRDIEPKIPSLMYTLIEQKSTRNSTLDKLMNYNVSLSRHKQYMPRPLVDISGYKIIEEDDKKEEDDETIKKQIKICKYVYEGKASEVIENANKFFAIQYNIRPSTIFYTSATSESEGSSIYHIDTVKPDYLIRHKDQDNQKVEIFMHIFMHEDEPIFVSGHEYRETALKLLSSKLSQEGGLLSQLNKDQLDFAVEEGESKPITLIVSNSYDQAKAIGRIIVSDNEFRKKDVSVLIKDNDTQARGDVFSTVTFNDLPNLYAKNTRILIAPGILINRALNILRSSTSHKSLIYDIIFPIRPYPSPEDKLSLISLINAEENRFRSVDCKENDGYEYLSLLKHRCKIKLEYISENGKWSELQHEDKRAIATNVFVDMIIQTAGRGRRGGTDVRVHFCDYSLIRGLDLDSIKKEDFFNPNTMLYYWMEFLNSDKELNQMLYKEIKKGFDNIQFKVHR